MPCLVLLPTPAPFAQAFLCWRRGGLCPHLAWVSHTRTFPGGRNRSLSLHLIHMDRWVGMGRHSCGWNRWWVTWVTCVLRGGAFATWRWVCLYGFVVECQTCHHHHHHHTPTPAPPLAPHLPCLSPTLLYLLLYFPSFFLALLPITLSSLSHPNLLFSLISLLPLLLRNSGMPSLDMRHFNFLNFSHKNMHIFIFLFLSLLLPSKEDGGRGRHKWKHAYIVPLFT